MKIDVLTCPYSKGSSSGAGGGPSAMLHAGLIEALRADGHDVSGPHLAEAPRDDLGDEMAVIEGAARQLSALVSSACARGALSLVLEGDCTAAPAVIGGLGAGGRVGLLWIDSHGDFNTPDTTPSGMLGGMPVAVSTGRCHAPWQEAAGIYTPLRDDDVVLAGIRDLDPPERAALQEAGVTVIESRGNPRAEEAELASAVARVAGNVDGLYIHVDVDVLNPASAQGFDMPVPGGPNAEELAEMVALGMRTGKATALGIAAYNPHRDANGNTSRAIFHLIEAGVSAAPGTVLA